MFYGEFKHTLDRKQRIIIPAKFREALKEHYIERFFITRGLDKCLFMFAEDEWKAQEQKFKSLSFTKAESRKFNRLYFSGASEIIPDKQGRILIPDYLRGYAQIKKEVYVIGVSNRIEIWSHELWEEYYAKSKDTFEDVAEKLIQDE
ncbi:MAG: cell division/cell wall cluster transcriptional repressor MraZ [Candidatus Omnitrophica bacterium CG02_land_8_20_14_3_00__42_8]|nr:MAG: cell division/cell wall cluster transcriptional repressor MraZ [Candidatus Omnitrophica bacterium CG02_land_8_20_14_3_00__42_8]PIW68496.1 MAG: cell division/cell wall cluster transcriptional repressor MraZ [Candidatus Omnitrophica bacterium CG12_big_fil_rev_8_21_14_0_65_42_8]